MLKYDYLGGFTEYVNAIYFAVVALEGFHDRHERQIKMFSEFGSAESFARKYVRKPSERIVISAVKDDGSYHYIEMHDWSSFREVCLLPTKKPPAPSIHH